MHRREQALNDDVNALPDAVSNADRPLRAFYTLLWWLALPALPLRLWWRGRREPGYREHRSERFGRYPRAKKVSDVVWIHAVSLGETRAAVPLVERLLKDAPAQKILLTHMTATGREAGRSLFGDRVAQAWLPYDVPFAVRAFLNEFRPRIGLLMETEMWPNLIAIANAQSIPMLLVNARLSQRSTERYRSVTRLSKPLFARLDGVAAQSQADAERLREVGVRNVIVTGNLKFDIDVSESERAKGRLLRQRFGVDRPVFLCASTREGEEALLLEAWDRARASLPEGLLMVIVPRHPQRFEDVARLLAARGIAYARRSTEVDISDDIRVVLGDSLGEMLAYYASADVAFVGGSLLALGGQNLIEAIAVGVPTVIGPHTFNFADASEAATRAGAALRVQNADELFRVVAQLLSDASARERMQHAAQTFIESHRGATDRLWQWLRPRILEATCTPSTR
jgi:3-deoxy-D-manno-octulosonic-acid transferase